MTLPHRTSRARLLPARTRLFIDTMREALTGFAT